MDDVGVPGIFGDFQVLITQFSFGGLSENMTIFRSSYKFSTRPVSTVTVALFQAILTSLFIQLLNNVGVGFVCCVEIQFFGSVGESETRK